MSTAPHTTWREAGAVATVMIDRPSTRNALALQTIDELRAAVARAEDDPAIRVLVLTGAGDRAFASGADLNEIPDAMDTPEKAAAYDETVAGLYRALLGSPVPVVARIQGHAIGGGLLLALACDLRICRAGVKVGLPVSRIGLMLSPLEHKLLVDQIGPSRAKWLLLTGRRLEAAEAATWGLVDMIAEEAGFDAAVEALAADIASGAPLAVAAAKKLITAAAVGSMDDIAEDCYRDIYTSADLKEGLAALAERRKPVFQGR